MKYTSDIYTQIMKKFSLEKLVKTLRLCIKFFLQYIMT